MEPTPVPEMTPEMTPDVVSEVETKKEARLSQLAEARKSAVAKKRKLNDDVSELNSKLDRLSALVTSTKKETDTEKAKDEMDEQPTKKVRVTKEPVEETVMVGADTWGTQIIRTAGLVGLAGATYYMQNVYGQKRKRDVQQSSSTPQPKKGRVQPTKTPMLPVVSKNPVGRSGFVV